MSSGWRRKTCGSCSRGWFRSSGTAAGWWTSSAKEPGGADRDRLCGHRGLFLESTTARIRGVGPPEGEVRFENASPRRFDLVVGADGLHSNVRHLVFDEQSRHSTFIGAYLGVLTLPNVSDLDGELLIHVGVGRTAGMYGARHLGEARALFLFRSERELDYHYRDVARQKELLRGAFAGMHAHVDRWLEELDRTPAFYLDSITQLHMDTWSQGRVTLVGDAGYCPGPAVGGSTTLAVVGAYVLAGELARAGGDHERAFPAYERVMAAHVRGSRAVAWSAAKTLIPTSPLGAWGLGPGPGRSPDLRPARRSQPRPPPPHHQERTPLQLHDRRRLSAVDFLRDPGR